MYLIFNVNSEKFKTARLLKRRPNKIPLGLDATFVAVVVVLTRLNYCAAAWCRRSSV